MDESGKLIGIIGDEVSILLIGDMTCLYEFFTANLLMRFTFLLCECMRKKGVINAPDVFTEEGFIEKKVLISISNLISYLEYSFEGHCDWIHSRWYRSPQCGRSELPHRQTR